jgi:hypothetical protein
MKKTSIRLGLAIIFSTLILAGCTKKEGEDQVEITAQTLAGSYKLTALTYKNPITGQNEDYLKEMDACEKDDIVTLNANYSANYTDAGTQCSPNGSYDNAQWQLDGKNIFIPGSSDDYSGEVKSFNGKTLVIEATYNIGITVTITATFTKQ